jgi:hypothetical protein
MSYDGCYNTAPTKPRKMVMTLADLEPAAKKEPRVVITANGQVEPKRKAKRSDPVPLDRVAGSLGGNRGVQSRLIPEAAPRPETPAVVEPAPPVESAVTPPLGANRPRREVRRPRLYEENAAVDEPSAPRVRHTILKVTHIDFDAERGGVLYTVKVQKTECFMRSIVLSAEEVCRNGGKDLLRAFHQEHRAVVKMPECVSALLD